ncbi:Rv0909 family putative TA system antitoxin [Litorihabitans aurantiacus]|uniref:Antitoxin n=1 Tax=Litorihabitans aurantiacus TaxID=1930061 RepID=A0AA38CW63_9MICO|nr:Rv0909 family putative TA system antitoxin [Litorihabitans aurantiacus]GMA33310.1 hypothetical protein GCM10025875_33020 [Litorihabitans aurantiacus]
MGLGDITGKAKDALGGGKADEHIDKGVDAVQEKTPDQVDQHVETGGDKLKDHLNKG